MGYETSVSGRIHITPPLTAADLRQHPEFCDEHQDAWVEQAREVVPTGEGELTRITGVAIVTLDGRWKRYGLVDRVQAIVSAFPDRTYSGRFECDGDDPGDLWRLEVHDGKAVKVTPRIVWPDGNGELPAGEESPPCVSA